MISEVYELLGCSKYDISRWKNNPCSVNTTITHKKINAINRAKDVFSLTAQEYNQLAYKAGLSLAQQQNGLAEIINKNNIRCTTLAKQAGVSERMLQYYISGREPVKPALLAIAISLKLDIDEIQDLLSKYGYCLSKSMPNDAIVLWFLENNYWHSSDLMLFRINEVLDILEMPLLMTKLYDIRCKN